MGSNRVRTLMVLETLMVFNGILCAVVGWILLIFMSKPAGLVGAIIFWVVASALWEGKRYVDRLLPFEGAGRSGRPVRRS
jgi:type IV secretory pathway TrbD component